jgi:hypothetical protein
MTLNTSIAIGKPYNVHEVYAYCRTLVNTPEHIKPNTGPDPEQQKHWPGQKYIANPGGIGLCAWLWINYGADGPMLQEPDDPNDQDEVDYLKNSPTSNGWAAIEVTFDTTYSYRSDSGEGCSQLHARLVAELGKWLDDRALPWKWQNEYTGEWFDSYNGLDAFVDAHRSTGAADWFNNTVLPLIESGGLR